MTVVESDARVGFVRLREFGLIALEGEDAVSFLHAQLTSDVATLAPGKTQYSGYCAPSGRLLATFLLWRLDEDLFLQAPRPLLEAIRSRLARYVLRAKVRLDVSAEWSLYGIYGEDAARAAVAPELTLPLDIHDVRSTSGLAITRIGPERHVMLVRSTGSAALAGRLTAVAREWTETEWNRLEIEAGVPWILPESQDRYIPQMVNLDLIGGVSFAKGCYPGQEIVARTHYLGRLKQRTYLLRADVGDAVDVGDALYSDAFGAEQASGTILNAAPRGEGGFAALAVLQKAAVAGGDVRWKSADGPPVELQALPYSIPE